MEKGMIARLRYGIMEERNKYWKKENEKIKKICEREGVFDETCRMGKGNGDERAVNY